MQAPSSILCTATTAWEIDLCTTKKSYLFDEVAVVHGRREEHAIDHVNPSGGREVLRVDIEVPCHNPRTLQQTQKHSGFLQDGFVGLGHALARFEIDRKAMYAPTDDPADPREAKAVLHAVFATMVGLSYANSASCQNPTSP